MAEDKPCISELFENDVLDMELVSKSVAWMTFAMRSRPRPILSGEARIAKCDLRVRRMGDE